MSLRSEIRAAIDDMAPSMGGLPERVVDTVLAEGPAHLRRNRMLFRMRAPLSLVAAIVAIALVAAVLVGGRLMQDWNAFHSAMPAGQAPSSQLAQLEARPIRIPVLSSISACQSGPYNAESSLGSGPVYADGGSSSVTNWGRYFYLDAYSDARINGPILVRGRDLLKSIDMVFVGQFAAGPVVGTDGVDGQQLEQHTELVLNTGQTSPGGFGPLNPHKYVWDFIAGMPSGFSGSTGWQVDGIGFSEVFVAC